MIVAMKKVTLLILDEDKDSVLSSLRDLGVMQITQSTPASVTSVSARDQYEQAKKTLAAIHDFAVKENLEIPVTESNRDGSAVLEEAQKRIDESAKLALDIAEVNRRIENLAVWGDFDRSEFDKLRERGVNILLCRGSVDDFKAAQKCEGVDCIEICRIKKESALKLQ